MSVTQGKLDDLKKSINDLYSLEYIDLGVKYLCQGLILSLEGIFFE